MSTSAPESTERSSRGRGRGRPRRLLRALLVLVLVFVLLATLGRYLVLPRVARSALADVSGAEVRFEGLQLRGDGIELHELELRVPGVSGEAGRLLSVKHADLDLRLESLLPLSVTVDAVHLSGAALRISQSERTGSLAAARLSLPAGAAKDHVDLPHLTLSRCAVEYGLHDEAGRFTQLTHIEMEGSAQPHSTQRGVYDVALRQLDPGDGRVVGLRVMGQVTPAASTASLTLRDLSFDDLSAEFLPQRVRAWWTRAAISGDVATASLEVTPDQVEAVITLADVDLSLDVPLAYMETEEPAPLRLRDAHGAVRFDQDGVTLDDLRVTVQELSCRVSGRYDGYSEDSAVSLRLEVAPFEYGQTSGLLPFVPLDVQRELHEFQFEQALLSGTITATRRAPLDASAQPLQLRAEFDVENCTGTTSHFPYPVTDAAGRISFSDGTLEVGLHGKGRTGADLDIGVSVVPKPINSEVDVRVTAKAVPVDDLLRNALWEESRRVIDELMDREAHDRLVAAGLLRVAESASGDDQAAAQAAAAEPPAFVLGALGDVDVLVHRGEDTQGDYDHHVTIDLHRGAFLYQHFAYPLRVRRGTIIVTDEKAWLDLPELEGPCGERIGRLEGTVLLSRDGADVYEPSIVVSVESMPIDRYLAQAIPGRASAAAEGPAEPAPSEATDDASSSQPPSMGGRLLAALQLVGEASGTATISPDGAGGVDYRVECAVESATAAPGDGSYALQDITGNIIVATGGVEISDLCARHGDTALLVRGSFATDPEAATGLTLLSDLTIEAVGLDLTDSLAALLTPFVSTALLDAGAVPDLAELQSRYQPTGKADVTVRAAAGPADGSSFQAEVRLIDPSFLLGETRLRTRGVIEGVTVTGTQIRLREAAVDLLDQDVSAAMLLLSGDWNWGEAQAGPAESVLASEPRLAGESLLNVQVRRGVVDSPLLGSLMRHAGAGALVETLRRHEIAGLVDAELLLARNERGEIDAQGEVRPTRIVIGAREFQLDAGSIGFDGRGAQIRDLRLNCADGGLSLVGELTLAEAGEDDATTGVQAADLRFSADFSRFDADEWASLVGSVGERLSALQVRAAERFAVRDGRLRLVRTGREEEDRLLFEMIATAQGASLDIGLPVSDLSGEVEVRVDRRPWQPGALVKVWGAADTFRLRDIEMSDLRFHVSSGDDPGELLVPVLEATCHEGELAGKARLLIDEGAYFELLLQMGNVRLGRALRDLQEVAASRGERPPEYALARPTVQGRVDASLALRGTAGRPESLSGHCTARIAGDGVVELPVMLALLQLSNFAPPVQDSFDLAQLDFHLEGQRLFFEKADLLGDTIWIDGRGSLDLEDLDIDMVFTTQGRMPLPQLGPIPSLFANLLIGVRDELVSMQASGTLYNPTFRPRALAQTRRTLAEIFGTRQDRLEKPIRRDPSTERRPGGSE